MAQLTKLPPKMLLKKRIDELGNLLARIADLEIESKEIKAWLKAKYGDGSYEGDIFRCTVSTYDKDTLNMEAVKRKLTAQFIRANTTTKAVTKVLTTARNATNLGNKKAA